MWKLNIASSYLVCILLLTACGEQGKTTQQQATEPSQRAITVNQKVDTAEHDPYFIPSLDNVSTYGPQVITRNILEDKNGDVWLATWNGLIRYDGKMFTNVTNQLNLRRYRFFSLLEDADQNLWFGTIGAGVYVYDGTTFTNFTTHNGLADDHVECLFADAEGRIWLGTDAGVSYFDGTTFRNFTVKDGLPDTDVHAITQDKSGKIWIASTGGISIFDGQSFTPFVNQQGNPFTNVRTIITTCNGDLWFGGNDGLFHYDGKNLTNLSTDFVGYVYEDTQGDIWVSVTDSASRKMALYRYPIKSFPSPLGQEKGSLIRAGEWMVFGITEDRNGNMWFGTANGVCRYDGGNSNCFPDTRFWNKL